ncbi:hypothetical protein DMI62_09435 [Escherichia coli]|nr:hypothetical protein [Escherichia coli]
MTRLAAKAGHLALYLLLFAIGISGYLIQLPMVNRSAFWLVLTSPRPSPTLAHRRTLPVPCILLAWSVVVLSVMRGFMALKHHFIDKDDTLKRMLGKSSSDYGV